MIERNSVAKIKAQFAREIEAAFERVRERLVSFDTINVLLRDSLSKAAMTELRRIHGRNIHFGFSKSLFHNFVVRIQRPTKQVLSALMAKGGPHAINRVDIAVDLIVPSLRDAEELKTFLHQRLTQPQRPKRARIREVEGTIYRAAAWIFPRNIVLYTRRSKINGQPCCHVEFRFYKAEGCRRIGLRQLADIVDPDAAKLLPAIFRNSRLSTLNWPKVEQAIDAFVGKAMLLWNRKPTTRFRRRLNRKQMSQKLRGILARILQSEEIESQPENLRLKAVQSWIDETNLVHNAVLSLPAHALVKGAQWAEHRPPAPTKQRRPNTDGEMRRKPGRTLKRLRNWHHNAGKAKAR